MLTVNRMTKWQAFMWLWWNDSEARWIWFKLWIRGKHLKDAVADNLACYGLTGRNGG